MDKLSGTTSASQLEDSKLVGRFFAYDLVLLASFESGFQQVLNVR